MRRISLVTAVTALAALPAFAKKTIDYVPPSWIERFERSFMFIGAVGFVLALLLILSSRFGTVRPGGVSILRFTLVLATCILVGAIWASSDPQNDELANPAFAGSIALSPSLAAALLILHPRNRRTILWASVLTVPYAAFLLLLTSFIQDTGVGQAW